MSSAEPHVGLERLADEAAGLLPPAESLRVRAHVAGCPQCRQDAARLAQVDAALAVTAADRSSGAMPDAVAARLDAALVDAAGSTPLRNGSGAGSDRRGGHGLRWASIAAVAAAVALVAAVVVGRLDSGTTPADTTAGTQAAGVPPVTAAELDALVRSERASGTRYTQQGLPAELAHTLTATGAAGTAGGAAPQLRSSGATPSATLARRPVPAPGPTPGALRPLAQPSRLLACVSQLTVSSAVTIPVAVDFARFDGKPAAVVVLAYDSAHDHAYVVGPTCGLPGADGALLRYQEVPAH